MLTALVQARVLRRGAGARVQPQVGAGAGAHRQAGGGDGRALPLGFRKLQVQLRVGAVCGMDRKREEGGGMRAGDGVRTVWQPAPHCSASPRSTAGRRQAGGRACAHSRQAGGRGGPAGAGGGNRHAHR